MANATDAELAVLNVLWDHGPSLIRDITQAVYGEHSQAKHTTVKSLLERLAAKGLVDSDTTQFSHTFSALLTRDQYVAAEMQRLADSHFSGSIAPMLLTLFKHTKIGKKERDSIRKIIDEMK